MRRWWHICRRMPHSSSHRPDSCRSIRKFFCTPCALLADCCRKTYKRRTEAADPRILQWSSSVELLIELSAVPGLTLQVFEKGNVVSKEKFKFNLLKQRLFQFDCYRWIRAFQPTSLFFILFKVFLDESDFSSDYSFYDYLKASSKS